MIKSYSKITTRYLKSNKKRSILTIIGIILSVALISTIGLFLKGLQAAEVQTTKDDYGSAHLVCQNLDKSTVNKITNNPKVARCGYYKADKNVITFDNKLPVQKISATNKGLELLQYRIKEGRFPKNNNEIALEKWVLLKIDPNSKIGSSITIENKSYTVCGILNNDINAQLKNMGTILTVDNNIDTNGAYFLVEFSSKVNIRNAINEVEKQAGKNNYSENTPILIVEGINNNSDTYKGIFQILAVIIGIVVVATVAVIYNSFHISVVERIKQFGLLRAVGSTPKQIRKIVLKEATILAVIGIPLGLLLGIFAMFMITIVFKLINKNFEQFISFTVSPSILIISALVGLAAIYVSALIPAIMAGSISPLEAISSRTSIKKEKIKKRKNIIASKLFGFEGSLAAKNIKRNKKRYRITIFSIIISVVLFIVFKSFTDMSFRIDSDINESTNTSFTISKTNTTEIDDKMLNEIKDMNTVKNCYKIYSPIEFNTVIDKDKEINELKNFHDVYKNITYNSKEMAQISASVRAYDEASLEASKKYLKSGSIDKTQLDNENGVILIYKNRIDDEKLKKTYMGPIGDIKVGDDISLQKNTPGQDETAFGSGKTVKVKVLAIVKNIPFDYNRSGINFITTENTAKKLSDNDARAASPYQLQIKLNDDKNEEGAYKKLQQITNSNPSLNIINNIDQNRNTKSSKLLVNFLLYGFVIVVSLISCINIINTMTTNLILRRREFATLKSIGLTQKGLRKMIVLEGLLYGIIGAIYGSVIGTSLSYLIYKGLSGIKTFSFSIPWTSIIISVVCAVLLGYIAVLSPLRRINRDNLIETIREE